jgi:uncharacterized membrane protein YvlD (DUF360 family)
MRDQPVNHISFLIAVAVLTLATAPFAFVGRPVLLVFGVPLWLWSSILFTVLLAGVTVWGALRWWKDDELD